VHNSGPARGVDVGNVRQLIGGNSSRKHGRPSCFGEWGGYFSWRDESTVVVVPSRRSAKVHQRK